MSQFCWDQCSVEKHTPLWCSSQVCGEPWHPKRRHPPSGGFSSTWRTAAFGRTTAWWSRMPLTLPERMTAFVTRPTGPTCRRNTRRRGDRRKPSRGSDWQQSCSSFNYMYWLSACLFKSRGRSALMRFTFYLFGGNQWGPSLCLRW